MTGSIVFVAILVDVCMGGSTSKSSMAYGVTTSTLVAKRRHFRIDLFPLRQVWAILQGVCLLDEKHVAMILACLNYLGPSSSVLIADLITLIWLWTQRSICMRNTILDVLLNLFIWLMAISCSESTKTWVIHLLLNQKTDVGIVFNVWLVFIIVIQILIGQISIRIFYRVGYVS